MRGLWLHQGVEGLTHYICDGCGSQLEELEPDPGFVPEGQTPTVLRDSGDRNQLGSRIDPSGDKASEKFRKKHMVASYQKPRFIDIIVRELVKKCGTGNSSQDAARLLIEVDSKERLGAVRKKRRGTKGMGKEESKEYKQGFAAATAHSQLQRPPNTTSGGEGLVWSTWTCIGHRTSGATSRNLRAP